MMRNRANPENCRALNRKYLSSDKGKAARARATKRYREKHAEKLKAHNAVTYALKKGVLQKQPCHCCGELRVEAHHPDYSAPLSVVWLCVAHHKQLHEEHDIFLRSQQHFVDVPTS